MRLGDLPVGSKFEFSGKPGEVLYSNDSRVLVRWDGKEKSWAPCMTVATDATGRADLLSAPATGNGTGGLSADGSPDTVFVETLAQFWDTHDITDFDGRLEEVPIAEHIETVNAGADSVSASQSSEVRQQGTPRVGAREGESAHQRNSRESIADCPQMDSGGEFLSRDEWLAARRTGIGSSDAAAILGKDPFRSALSVYQSKVAPTPDEWRWEFARGNALEEVIARQFAEDHPEIVVDPFVRGIYNHPEHDWLICTPDRILRRADDWQAPPFAVLEMKTWSGRAWRDWAEGVPLHIQIQVQHQLLVSGFDEGWVSVSIGGDPPEHYHVNVNERFHRVLVPVLAEFWVRVQERRPPEPDGSEASREAIAALWPREAKGKVISLPGTWSVTDEHRELLKAEIAERKAELDEIDNRIKLAMGDAETAVLDSGVEYTLRQQTRKAYQVAESSFRVLRRKAAE